MIFRPKLDTPSFKFNDWVEVRDGFYKGCRGKIRSFVAEGVIEEEMYDLSDGTCQPMWGYGQGGTWREKDLKKVEEP